MALTGALAASKLKLLLVGVVVVSAGAGGAIVLTSDGGVPSDEARAGIMNSVPQGVDYVVYGNTNVFADNTTEALYEGLRERGGANGDAAPTYDEALQSLETGANLSLDDVDSVLAFGRYPDPGANTAYAGVLVESSWNESGVVDAMAATGAEFETRTYNGHTVYVNSSASIDRDGYFGVLRDGLYVAGTRAAVHDAIDTAAGDAASFDGALRDALSDTANGYYEFAATVPEARLPDESEGPSVVETAPFDRIEVVSGSYFADDDTFGVRMTATAANRSDAGEILNTSKQALLIAPTLVGEEALRRTLADVNVTRDGRYVTFTYETTAEAFLDTVELLAQQELSGTAAASLAMTPPHAAAVAEP